MNSELYNNLYKIPKDILTAVNGAIYKYPNSDGIKRAKNIVNSGTLTYQNLKRLKNFFKNNSNGSEFELAGGGSMRNYVDKVLNTERSRTSSNKEVMRDIKSDANADFKTQNSSITSSLHEEDEKEDTPEVENKGLKLNVVAIIIDKDKRILLLKRSNFDEQWQPNKWSLPGGGVEEGESPDDALKREVVEETGIKFDKYIEKFVVQRSSDNIEHIFTIKFEGEPEDVDIDFENNGFGWFTLAECRYLDTVPNLLDYIRMAITNYE